MAKLAPVKKVGAAALLELGAAMPAIVALTHEAFAAPRGRSAPAPEASPPTAGTCSKVLNPHDYATTAVFYETSQTSLSKGVGGMQFTLHSLPGTWNFGKTTAGKLTFVDQEQWFETDLSAPNSNNSYQSWVENGVVVGGHYKSGTSAVGSKTAFFVARATESTVSGVGFSPSYAEWVYSNDSSIPYYQASEKFTIAMAKSNPLSNSVFNTSVVTSPHSGHGHRPLTRSAPIRHRAIGPYFYIKAGSESTCADHTHHENNLYDGSGQPNLMDVSMKVYDSTSRSWKWLANWLPAGDNANFAHYCPLLGSAEVDSKNYCQDLNTYMLWSDTYSGSHLTKVGSGEYPYP